MAFWSESFENTTKDPKRKYRFKVTFDGLSVGANDTIWFAKTCGKPNFTVTESDHTFLNHKFYYPGRVEWQTISMTLVDPQNEEASTAEKLTTLAEAAGYTVPDTANATLKSMSKGKAASSIGTVTIQQLDAEGEPIEEWKLVNPFIKTFKWGDLDYSADDLLELELELRYDWAECTIGNTVFFKPNSGAAQ